MPSSKVVTRTSIRMTFCDDVYRLGHATTWTQRGSCTLAPRGPGRVRGQMRESLLYTVRASVHGRCIFPGDGRGSRPISQPGHLAYVAVEDAHRHRRRFVEWSSDSSDRAHACTAAGRTRELHSIHQSGTSRTQYLHRLRSDGSDGQGARARVWAMICARDVNGGGFGC